MLFTSIFDLGKTNETDLAELNLLIFKLHAYRINLIILGYEICDKHNPNCLPCEKDGIDPFADPNNKEHAKHETIGTTPDENRLFDFINRIKNFDIRRVKKEYTTDGTFELSFHGGDQTYDEYADWEHSGFTEDISDDGPTGPRLALRKKPTANHHHD